MNIRSKSSKLTQKGKVGAKGTGAMGAPVPCTFNPCAMRYRFVVYLDHESL